MRELCVRALVPTAIAARLLAEEFPSASLISDGTLSTVVIYGIGYTDAASRIREWMAREQVGPVLVTDGETAEELLDERGRRIVASGRPTEEAPPVVRGSVR